LLEDAAGDCLVVVLAPVGTFAVVDLVEDVVVEIAVWGSHDRSLVAKIACRPGSRSIIQL
jgi:hypothetical protein